jgi:hypothetical protein
MSVPQVHVVLLFHCDHTVGIVLLIEIKGKMVNLKPYRNRLGIRCGWDPAIGVVDVATV